LKNGEGGKKKREGKRGRIKEYGMRKEESYLEQNWEEWK